MTSLLTSSTLGTNNLKVFSWLKLYFFVFLSYSPFLILIKNLPDDKELVIINPDWHKTVTIPERTGNEEKIGHGWRSDEVPRECHERRVLWGCQKGKVRGVGGGRVRPGRLWRRGRVRGWEVVGRRLEG